MSKGLSIPEGTTVYIPAVRVKGINDDEQSVNFKFEHTSYLRDEQFLTEEELKEKFNEGFPKQGEMIEARYTTSIGTLSRWFLLAFVGTYKGKILVDSGASILGYDEWRYPKKTELTLAEVEEKLGMEKGSLIIK